jgi:hypothetical protein
VVTSVFDPEADRVFSKLGWERVRGLETKLKSFGSLKDLDDQFHWQQRPSVVLVVHEG